jgi:non-specific serine/threonine protein kinase
LDRQVQDTHSLAITLNNLGDVARHLGSLDRAQEWFEEAVALFRELDARATLGQSLQGLASLQLKRGEYAQVAEVLRESLTIAGELKSPQNVAFCLESFAQLAAAQAQMERAARLFGAAEGLREVSGALLSTGSRTALQPTVDAVHSGLTEDTWCSAQAEGRAMSLERAVEYALSLLERPPPDLAPPLGTVAEQPPSALTRREVEIAELIAQGLTNRQIAEQLVLSERTVDAHAANIMRKLGLGSRAQVASWVSHQELGSTW